MNERTSRQSGGQGRGRLRYDLFVFDLGNVILPFDHAQVAEKLHARSRRRDTFSAEDLSRYLFGFQDGFINLYEEGMLSSMEFYLSLRDRYGLEVDFDEFKEIWNDIFTENHEVNEIIMYLKARGSRVYLLSNTNELHFSHVLERYPIVHMLDEWILSFEVGAKKPKRRIYDAIFEKADVDRGRVLYIDDVEFYVEMARSLGINGLVFKEPSDVWAAVLDGEGSPDRPRCSGKADGRGGGMR